MLRKANGLFYILLKQTEVDKTLKTDTNACGENISDTKQFKTISIWHKRPTEKNSNAFLKLDYNLNKLESKGRNLPKLLSTLFFKLFVTVEVGNHIKNSNKVTR